MAFMHSIELTMQLDVAVEVILWVIDKCVQFQITLISADAQLHQDVTI